MSKPKGSKNKPKFCNVKMKTLKSKFTDEMDIPIELNFAKILLQHDEYSTLIDTFDINDDEHIIEKASVNIHSFDE